MPYYFVNQRPTGLSAEDGKTSENHLPWPSELHDTPAPTQSNEVMDLFDLLARPPDYASARQQLFKAIPLQGSVDLKNLYESKHSNSFLDAREGCPGWNLV